MAFNAPPVHLLTRVGRWFTSAGGFFRLLNNAIEGPDDERRPEENEDVAAPRGGQHEEELVNADDGNARPPTPPQQQFQPPNWMYEQHWHPAAHYAPQPVHYHPYNNAFPFAYPDGDPFIPLHYAASFSNTYWPVPWAFHQPFPDAFHHPAADPALHLGPYVDPQGDQWAVIELLQLTEAVRREAEAEDNHPQMDVGVDDETRQNTGGVIYVENIGPLEPTRGSSLSEDTESPSTSGLSSSRRRIRDESDDEAAPPKRPRWSDDSDSD